jgi:hypothetical protein
MTISSLGPNAWNWSVSQPKQSNPRTGSPTDGTNPSPQPPPQIGPSPGGGSNNSGQSTVSGSADPFQALASDLQALLTQYQSSTNGGALTSSTSAGSGSTNTNSGEDVVQKLLSSLSSALGLDPTSDPAASGSASTTGGSSTDTTQTANSASTGEARATHHHRHHPRSEGTDADGPRADQSTVSTVGASTSSSSAANGTAAGSSATGPSSLQAVASQLMQALQAYAGGGSVGAAASMIV